MDRAAPQEDLLTRIVRADLPAFTDLLLERLLKRQDVQVTFCQHFFFKVYVSLLVGDHKGIQRCHRPR